MKRTALALAVGGLVLVALSVTSGLAQAQAAYGVLDTARVSRDFKGMQQVRAEFSEFAQAQQATLIAHEKVMMLSDADYTRYFDTQAGGAPTEENKKKLADLEAAATQREQRFQELMSTKERTPDQQKEYDDLNKVYTAHMGELQKLKDDLDKQVSDKNDALLKRVSDQVDAAVKAVAEQKKLSLVFVKDALIYGGTDVTDEVLAKLNGPAPATPAAAPAAAVPAGPAGPGK